MNHVHRLEVSLRGHLRSSWSPFYCHQGPVASSSVFAVLLLELGNNEKPQALILHFHAKESFHFITISGGIMPRTPVTSQLGEFCALNMHVLGGCCHSGCFFPFWQAFGSRLPPHDDGYHVGARPPPSRDFIFRHFPPGLILFLGTNLARTPPKFMPISIVILESHLLHFYHALFSENDKPGGMLLASKAFTMKRAP